MMPDQPRDLDAIIHDRGYTGRIETSVTLPCILARLGPGAERMVKTFVREGLGHWRALGVAFDGVGDTFVAVPSAMRGAGCSVWFRPTETISAQTLAGAIAAMWPDDPPDSITPEGEAITPVQRSPRLAIPHGPATSRIAVTAPG